MCESVGLNRLIDERSWLCEYEMMVGIVITVCRTTGNTRASVEEMGNSAERRSYSVI